MTAEGDGTADESFCWGAQLGWNLHFAPPKTPGKWRLRRDWRQQAFVPHSHVQTFLSTYRSAKVISMFILFISLSRCLSGNRICNYFGRLLISGGGCLKSSSTVLGDLLSNLWPMRMKREYQNKSNEKCVAAISSVMSLGYCESPRSHGDGLFSMQLRKCNTAC